MAKDTYYFSHDSNARNDIKIIRLRRALGMEGYGIYFSLIEILREQEGYKLSLETLTDVAFELHTSEEKVRAVVLSYDLFIMEDEIFFSARLLRSMDEFNSKRQKFIDAGRKGGEASVKHRLSIAQPLKVKVKESIGNESKEKDSTESSIILSVFSDENQTTPNVVKNKWIETFDNRVKEFKKSLYPFTNYPPNNGSYSREMVAEFFNYWIEPNKSRSRMRWETEKTWELSKRLANWSKNDKIPRSSNNSVVTATPQSINHDNRP